MRPGQLIGKKRQNFPKVRVHCKNLKIFFEKKTYKNVKVLIKVFSISEKNI